MWLKIAALGKTFAPASSDTPGLAGSNGRSVVCEFPDGGRNVAFDDSKVVIRREQDLMKTIFWDKLAGMRPGDTRMTSCSLVQL